MAYIKLRLLKIILQFYKLNKKVKMPFTCSGTFYDLGSNGILNLTIKVLLINYTLNRITIILFYHFNIIGKTWPWRSKICSSKPLKGLHRLI